MHSIIRIKFLKLICWKPGQTTDIHNHPSYNSCDYKILSGELVEHVYNLDMKIIDSNVYRENNIGNIEVMNKFHIVTNDFKNNAVSLHIYHKNK